MTKITNYLTTNNTLIILLTSLLLLTQFASDKLADSGYISYMAIFVIGIFASVGIIIKAIRTDNTISFNAIDLSFLTFIFLLLLRWIDSDSSWVYSKATIAIAIIPLYFFVRQYKQIFHFHLAIVICGIVQVVVAILQKIGIFENINASFQVAGLVSNPNILAILLLLSLPSAIFIFSTTKSKTFKVIDVIYIIVSFALIVLTKCRSAIIGCIVIGIFFLYKNKRLIVNRYIKLLCSVVLIISCAGFVYLLFEKSGSLFGRLLIWQSCFMKIVEKPLLGFGISSFHRVYPEAQRLFLETNPSLFYLKFADSPQWAYNDFIELWMEGGLFIALSFIFVLFCVLYYWRAQKQYNIHLNNISYLTVLIFFVVSILFCIYGLASITCLCC